MSTRSTSRTWLPRAALVIGVLLAIAGCEQSSAPGEAPATTQLPGFASTVEASWALDATGTTGTILIRNGLLIDGRGTEPIPNAAVLIEDGIIVAVGPETEVEAPDTAFVLDAQGGAILPGMIDAHTHLLAAVPVEDGTISGLYQNVYLRNPLEAGLTTIMDLGSTYATADEVRMLRTALEELGNGAPRVVLAGPFLTAPGSWPMREFSGMSTTEVLDSPEAAAAATNALIDAGVDQIKIIDDPGPDGDGVTLGLERLTAIVEAAHSRNTWVTAHTEVSTIDDVIASGVDNLAHWPTSWPLGTETEIPRAILETLARNRTPVVSTFNITRPTPEDLRAFLDMGGTIAMGTDAPGTGAIQKYSRELIQMVSLGMTPMEAIVASTANAANVVGLGDQVGTIEPGKLADIIVLGSNPLDDVQAIRDDIVYVIRGGEVVFSSPE